MTDTINTPTNPAPEEPSSEQELIRVQVMSSPKAVNMTIQNLANLGFAQVSEWSRLVPGPRIGQVTSTLNRYIPKQ